MRPLDTSPASYALQLELYRAAGPTRRAQIALELSEATRATTVAGIRARHPEYSEKELKREFIRIVYGVELDW